MKAAALDLAGRDAAGTPESRGLARDEVRLMVSGPDGHRHGVFRDLPEVLAPGTLLVVNTSATLPASLDATGPKGAFTLNLSTRYGRGLWLAEPRVSPSRPGPLPLTPGEAIEAAGVPARLIAPFPSLPRLWFVRFAADIEPAMAAEGRPIRYAYLAPPFPPLAAYQTVFAGPQGSAEMPSAGRPFSGRILAGLARRGIAVAPILLHTGVSSLELDPDDPGPPALYPEPFAVPATTAAAVNAARREGRPVIAVGTTVVRALESAWDGEALRPARGFTRLFVDPARGVYTVDGLITGLHDPRATHLAMLDAVGGAPLVRSAYEEALRQEYLWHEFGDSHLILRG
jgi:S-adenosylmethionine:tRNA ribosyltransferase-isomerase